MIERKLYIMEEFLFNFFFILYVFFDKNKRIFLSIIFNFFLFFLPDYKVFY